MSAKNDGVQRPRRFYKAVTTGAAEGGFAVLLDGRTPRTPAGHRLVLPTQALADVVAADWEAQREEIDTVRMPAMRLAATAIDRVVTVREDVAEEVSRYAGSDLVCYRAESPSGLVEAQARAWDPLLAWADEQLGLTLETTGGILHRAQPQASLARARALALEGDHFALTGLAQAAGLFGSAVLAFAVQRGRLDGRGAHDLARLDEAWQEERWGVDYEAADRTAARLEEALLLDRWFAALR
ncbi:MAG: ATPase [Caulobacter sp.]|nr:ATPase [Caulobacter sp.]